MPGPNLSDILADSLADGGWRAQARANQLPPPGDWNGWVVCAGRGWGKTRVGSEWVRECVETGIAGRIALIAPTAGDAREVMVEGPAGILATASPWCHPEYEPSKRRLTWPNGSIATTFSAEESDRLRGPQHDLLWADELAAWQNVQDTWDMAMFGLRLGAHPRWLITTTPRPIKTLKQLIARVGQDVVLTSGSTFENAANLAPSALQALRSRYEGTRLGRQELNAELLVVVRCGNGLGLMRSACLRLPIWRGSLLRSILRFPPTKAQTRLASSSSASGSIYVSTCWRI